MNEKTMICSLDKNGADILVVDDIPDNLRIVIGLLTKAGYKTRSVPNGELALQAVAMKTPDLILLDIRMPGMDGFAVCEALRERPESADIPIVFLSALTDDADKKCAFDAGGVDYITKPFHAPEVLARVNTHVRLRRMQLALEQKVAIRAVQLHESEERYRRIFESMEEGYFLTDMEGTIVSVNPATRRILQADHAHHLEGKNISSEICADPMEMDRLAKALAQDDAVSGFVTLFKRKDGAEVNVDCNVHLIRSDDGAPAHIEGTFRDITDRKRLELQLCRAQRIEAIGTLASGIAHDINNILAPMLMATSFLKENANDDQDRAVIQMIEDGALRGKGITRQLLTFARGDDGPRVMLQPNQLTKEMLSIMRETFPRNIAIVETSVPDVRSLMGDGTQLHQVIMNLCVNARDAMPNGGTLRLGWENVTFSQSDRRCEAYASPGNYVVLTVQDTGHGMPPAVMERIFDPFFTTKEVGRGTGLGLYAVSGIIRGHGGFVSVTSELNTGTVFKVYLPASSDIEKGKPSLAAVSAMTAAGNGELILVVDDESMIRDMLQRILTRRGYRVIVADNGESGILLFQKFQREVKLVLTDVMMPVMDGPTMIRELRILDPGVRIIASSGLAESDRRQELMDVGIKDFLDKPFTTATLYSAIDGLLNERAG